MSAARSNAGLLISLVAGATLVMARGAAPQPPPPATAGQQPAPPAVPPRPTPPTRDPLTPGYVTAKELPDGAVPPADPDGNFIIGAKIGRASCRERVWLRVVAR